MHKNSVYQAFTLIELLVWITILWILALWIIRIDFNRLSQDQNAEIESTKMINILQGAKNNALIGRWVGINLENPINWKVIVENLTSSWSIESQWELESGATWTLSSWTAKFPFEITNLECQAISGTQSPSSINSATLIYTGSTSWISWCPSSLKKIRFDFWTPWNTKEISINTVTGVIETN